MFSALFTCYRFFLFCDELFGVISHKCLWSLATRHPNSFWSELICFQTLYVILAHFVRWSSSWCPPGLLPTVDKHLSDQRDAVTRPTGYPAHSVPCHCGLAQVFLCLTRTDGGENEGPSWSYKQHNDVNAEKDMRKYISPFFVIRVGFFFLGRFNRKI